jgi:hypothetical protein
MIYQVILSAVISSFQAPGPERAESEFVRAVERVVEALDAKDYERFESCFTESTIGLQPDELWQGAFGVLAKFGKVTRLDFSRRDEASAGAFVKVQFERAVREVFVRLSREGKLRELTYVPPPDPHR